MHRRDLVKQGIAAAAVATTASRCSIASADELQPGEQPLTRQLESALSRPVFIATWPFGRAACQKSLSVLSAGGSLRDAIEKGINVTELDTSISSVGLGGYPNAAGVVQLDASFMDGERQQAGAVAALEGFPNAISAARRVMEQTPHAMLVGKDASAFAKAQGLPGQNMLTEEAKQAWLEWKQADGQTKGVPEESHDTIALLGVDASGHVVGGCSTSGLAFKLPGRVGDSPLIGSGLYVDGQVGAAGATGVGENVLRYCGSFMIVEFMRQGLSPTEACVQAIGRIADGEKRKPEQLSVNFVAVHRDGRVGAAGTDAEFRCALVDAEHALVVKPKMVS